MSKLVVINDLTTPAVILTGTYDFATFVPNFFYLFTELPDQRIAYPWTLAGLHKVTISPEGVAYPGDAVPGTGPKKVTIDLTGALVTVVMTLVDNVQADNGWLVITKGDHVIAYSPSVIVSAIVEPS